MSSIQNANPTILSASDLPTRNASSAQRRRNPLAAVVPAYTVDPFSDAASSGSDSDAEVNEGDELEPIDAQEIYGTP